MEWRSGKIEVWELKCQYTFKPRICTCLLAATNTPDVSMIGRCQKLHMWVSNLLAAAGNETCLFISGFQKLHTESPILLVDANSVILLGGHNTSYQIYLSRTMTIMTAPHYCSTIKVTCFDSKDVAVASIGRGQKSLQTACRTAYAMTLSLTCLNYRRRSEYNCSQKPISWIIIPNRQKHHSYPPPFTKMPLNSESIIALITLLVACPPTFYWLFKLLERSDNHQYHCKICTRSPYLHTQSESSW